MEFLATDPAARERLDRVVRLIEGFETPFGMELLATVHWVMVQREGARDDIDITIAAVQQWSRRKAAAMKPVHIRAAWAHLREQGVV
jgi:hypothetical protein